MLASDAHLTGKQEIAGSISAGSVKIDHEIFSTIIFSRWFKKDSCQFLAKACTQILVNPLED